MSKSNSKGEDVFVSATTVSAAEEMLDKLVGFRPIETRAVETKIGISEATIAQAVEVADDGTVTDLGERPIFWQVVRRQLAAATPSTPWVAGRLVQSGQAFRLLDLTAEETTAVRGALAKLTA
jgi:hypothetical protein